MAGRILKKASDPLSSSARKARFTIKGRNFGSCGGSGGPNPINGMNTAQGRWVKVAGGKVMCAASCPQTLGQDGRCNPGAISKQSWINNNVGAIASVTIAGFPCLDILWYSPFAFTCTIDTSRHPALVPDVSKGVAVTLVNGLSSSDVVPSPGEENVATGDFSSVAHGAYRAPPLLRMVAPEVVRVLPNTLFDHPSRGPLVIIGHSFGTRAMWSAGTKHNRRDELPRFSPADARHIARLGGELRPDGSIAFTHTPATLQTAVYSRLSGTDLSNATAPALPLTIWVGRRPCLRAVWYSDSVVTCECVQRDKRDDATITPTRARAVLGWKIRLAFVEKESDLFLDVMPSLLRLIRTKELFEVLTGEQAPSFDAKAISQWAEKKVKEVKKDKEVYEAMEKMKLNAAGEAFKSEKAELEATKQQQEAKEPVPLSLLELAGSKVAAADNETAAVLTSLTREAQSAAAMWFLQRAVERLSSSATDDDDDDAALPPSSFLELEGAAEEHVAAAAAASWPWNKPPSKEERARPLDLLHRVGFAKAGDMDSSAFQSMLFRDKRTGYENPTTFPAELDSAVSLEQHVQLHEARAKRLNFWRKDWPADDYSDIFGGTRPVRWDASPLTAFQAYLKQNAITLGVEKGSLLQRLYDFVSARNRKLYLGVRPPWVEEHIVVYSQGRRSSPYYYPIMPAPPKPKSLAYQLGPQKGTTDAGRIANAAASFAAGSIKGLAEEVGLLEARLVPFSFSCPHEKILRPFRNSVSSIVIKHEELAKRDGSLHEWDVQQIAEDMAGGEGFFKKEAEVVKKTVRAFNDPAPYENRDLYKFKQEGLSDANSNETALLEMQSSSKQQQVRHNRRAGAAAAAAAKTPEEDAAAIAAVAAAAELATTATTAPEQATPQQPAPETKPPAKAKAAGVNAASDGQKNDDDNEAEEEEEDSCVMRVPTIEARFDLPKSYYGVYDRLISRSASGAEEDNNDGEGENELQEQGAVISPGCGCSGLADLASRKDVITLRQIPLRCRREMDRYAWRLGCDSLRWSVAQSCGVRAAMKSPPAILDVPLSAFPTTTSSSSSSFQPAAANKDEERASKTQHQQKEEAAAASKATTQDVLALSQQLDAAMRATGQSKQSFFGSSATSGSENIRKVLEDQIKRATSGRSSGGNPELGFEAVSSSLERLFASVPGQETTAVAADDDEKPIDLTAIRRHQNEDEQEDDGGETTAFLERSESEGREGGKDTSKARHNRRLLAADNHNVPSSTTSREKDAAVRAASAQVLKALVESLNTNKAGGGTGEGIRAALTPQCQALAAIAQSPRCSVFSDEWLPDTMLKHFRARAARGKKRNKHGGSSASSGSDAESTGLRHRFSELEDDGSAGAGAVAAPATNSSSSSNSSAPLPLALDPAFIPMTQREKHQVVSSTPLPAEPVPVVMSAVAGDIAFWERRSSSLCHRGSPPTPRKGMSAILLGDGVSAVFYGGQSEAVGPAYKQSNIGGQFPLRPVTLNETMLLTLVADDEADAFDGYSYGCTAVESDKGEALRALPTRRKATSGGAYPLHHSRYTDGSLHYTSSGDYGNGPTYRTFAAEFGKPNSAVYDIQAAPQRYVGGAAAAETDDGGFD